MQDDEQDQPPSRCRNCEAMSARLDTAEEAKRSFLGTVSHEIRTPLNGIVTVAQLMMTSGDPMTDKQRRHLQTIAQCSVQLLVCVNDILDYSKLKSNSLCLCSEPFSLRTLLTDVEDLSSVHAQQKQLTFYVHRQESLPARYLGDATRLRQVLLNLINNAIRFTTVGSVTLAVSGECEASSSSPSSSTDQSKWRLHFSVTDTGCGVQYEERERIFDPFTQGTVSAVAATASASSQRGTGLGLAISRELVERMGGRLWLDSSGVTDNSHGEQSGGDGARFCFDVLLSATEGDEQMLNDHASTLRGKRVLIVDDLMENRVQLCQIALKWGLVPQLCSSGDEALCYVQSMQLGQCAPFALCWIDVRMVGMSGVELAREIRRTCSSATAVPPPMISLSSVGVEFDGSSEFDVTLEKPVVELLLMRTTLNLLLQRRANESDSDESMQQQAVSSSAAAAAADNSHRRGLNILIADDDLVSRQVMVDVLDTCADLVHHVKVVSDGTQVLHYINAALKRPGEQSGPGHFDVVLLDVFMPGASGLECARKIRASLPKRAQPHIVIITANMSDRLREQCVAAQIDYYITKPVDVQQLHSILKSLASSVNARQV